MTEREQTLYDWLHQACALLAIEARDHEENRQWEDRKQRKNLAKTLRRFLVQATNVLDDAQDNHPQTKEEFLATHGLSAPGHTDLMVRPETLDDYLKKNPPPD